VTTYNILWRVSKCMARREITVKLNEVFGCLFYLHDTVGNVVCVLSDLYISKHVVIREHLLL
jgi:hypothetical protein